MTYIFELEIFWETMFQTVVQVEYVLQITRDKLIT